MGRFSNVFKNISYTLTSNFLSLAVSIIVSVLLPKILGVSDYGYYQLYIFYVSYVGLLHLGWCDGIYLRYGGKEYRDLDKKIMAGQFYGLALFQILISLLFIVSINLINTTDMNKELVLYSVIANIVILNLRSFYLLILQTTDRMKDYSVILLVDRLIYVTIVIILILFGVKDFKKYMYVDILSKLISLIIAMVKCSDIPLERNIEFSKIETKLNVYSGINLMLANIASMLIIGIVRFGIQSNWDVETFGKISLTLSISNMLMVFVGAVSLAIFPIIKKTSEKNYSTIYPMIRTLVMPTVLVLLLLYFPIEILLSKWLPEYSESLKYMVIVFPMIIFESKVGLLTNTFLKAMRKEKVIFRINLISALLSLLFTFIFVYILNSLFLSMLSIVILLSIRSTLSEVRLKKILDIKVYKDIILEMLLVTIFITFGWNYSKLIGFSVYFFSLIIYFVIKAKDIEYIIKEIKK